MSLLPFSEDNVEAQQEGELQVLGIDDEQTSEVLDAISSKTARAILSHVFANPSTATVIAENINESVQTVSYHLSKLQEAGAIEVADTRYSEKGQEMNVYGPADDPMVVFVGTDDRRAGLLTVIKRFISAIAVVITTSYLIGYFVEDSIIFGIRLAVADGGGPDIPFALAFLVGGLFVLFIIAIWVTWERYLRRER
ncbi:MAG: helix-turn-helix domain-containing protein [Halodesulfurarchaeum sp.]|nr:helix-turn-helix domain-containing protein [Halodesulfurarchaeum sp.]